MINRDTVTKIRDLEMDRKAFLKYSGLLLLSVVGLQGVLSVLSKIDKQPVAAQSNSGRGFGAGKYGM